MLTVAIEEVLTIISALIPYIGVGTSAASAIETIVGLLVKLMPQIATLSGALVQEVSSIIADLQSSGALTTDQMTAMTTFAAQCDAAFNAAADAADAADPTTPPAAAS